MNIEARCPALQTAAQPILPIPEMERFPRQKEEGKDGSKRRESGTAGRKKGRKAERGDGKGREVEEVEREGAG